jgi:hypothetical protein
MPQAHYMIGAFGDFVIYKVFYGYSHGGKIHKLQFNP